MEKPQSVEKMAAHVWYWLNLPPGTRFYSANMGVGFVHPDLQAVRLAIRVSIEMWGSLPTILANLYNTELGSWNNGQDMRLHRWMEKRGCVVAQFSTCTNPGGFHVSGGTHSKHCQCKGSGQITTYRYTGSICP